MNAHTPNPFDPFKAQLLALRTELLARITNERGGWVSRAEVAADHYNNRFDSRAQIETERQAEFAMNEHESVELMDIAAALGRIAAGSYGTCCDCAAPIPHARLSAYPTAKRCIACQTRKEQRR